VETFAFNFVATVPLYFLSDFAVEEMGLRLGDTFAELLCVSTKYVTPS
jgi:hypothetical protein